MTVLEGVTCVLTGMVGITYGAIMRALALESQKDILALLRRIEELEERP